MAWKDERGGLRCRKVERWQDEVEEKMTRIPVGDNRPEDRGTWCNGRDLWCILSPHCADVLAPDLVKLETLQYSTTIAVQ